MPLCQLLGAGVGSWVHPYVAVHQGLPLPLGGLLRKGGPMNQPPPIPHGWFLYATIPPTTPQDKISSEVEGWINIPSTNTKPQYIIRRNPKPPDDLRNCACPAGWDHTVIGHLPNCPCR